MKILLTGKDGQVGFALHKKLASLGEVIATNRDILDLTNPDMIRTFIDKTKPDIIINPAAYTKVDQAETESQLAYQINTVAPQVLAEKASELNIPIIHFSTNYVFDGLKEESYTELDLANPQSVYGKTKLGGENAIRSFRKHIILRTSMVFGLNEKNFLATILKFIREKEIIYIVNDQKGTPTSASFLADVTVKIVDKILNDSKFIDFGTYHISSKGETNWYEYACFIMDESIKLGLQPTMTTSTIKAVTTLDYYTPAKRPLNSTLDSKKIKNMFMIELPYWQNEVKNYLKEIIK